MGSNPFQERSSRLLRGLKIAAAEQAEKSFRGNSPDRSASAKVSGSHQIEELRLDEEKLSLPAKKCRLIEQNITEAVNRALQHSQQAARSAIRQGLEKEEQ